MSCMRSGFIRFCAFAAMLCAFEGNACKGEPVLAKLQSNVRITAQSQFGLRLEGRFGVPVLLSYEESKGAGVKLINLGQAKRFEDTRSLWERISSKLPRYQEKLIANTLELVPESSGESILRYRAQFKDGSETMNVELVFEGGAQKQLRGGCGGGHAKVEAM